jgi:6-phosphogluconolactonase
MLRSIAQFALPLLLLISKVRAAENAPPDNPSLAPKATKMFVYIGTYTNGKSKGIHSFEMDMATGGLKPIGVSPMPNPTYLAVHPSQRFLYAVNEVDQFEAAKGGAISALAIDRKTGQLTPLNHQSTGAPSPCHLSFDATGKFVFVANYSGSIAVFPVEADGRVGKATDFVAHHGSSANPQRQEGPHAHSIAIDPANRFVLAADLGLDKLFVYRFDASAGKLSPNEPAFFSTAPGAGPRHFAFHPNGKIVYLINELNSTIDALSYDAAAGTLKSLQTVSTLPKDFHGGNTTAEIEIDPAGRFLYGSNRGHDSLAQFAIDGATGKLTFVARYPSGGKTPRGFALDPTGHFLVCGSQDSNRVVVMRVDPKDGRLTPTEASLEVGAPVSVVFVPAAVE